MQREGIQKLDLRAALEYTQVMIPIPEIQLAPMEGVFDWVLRELLSEVGGIDRMVTEFVRVTDRLLPDHVFYRYSPELEKQNGRTRSGTPVFVQLLGGQPGPMAENARRVAELGAPGIDLNFGCPARTVNRHDGGAALLRNPERLESVIKAVRAAVPDNVPVTAKVRLGYDSKNLQREIAHAAEQGGAAHIVVHARTKAEMYTPPAHWECIAEMSEEREIPFLANGDIFSPEDYFRCAKASQTKRVALGRGLLRRPTLAREIQSGSSSNRTFDRAKFLSRFYSETFQYRGDQYALARFKQILRYWSEESMEAKAWFQTAKSFSAHSEILKFLTLLKEESRDVSLS